VGDPGEAGHLLIALDAPAVDLVVAADRLAAEVEVTLPAVAAVTPQVVAAEDIAVAAVRTEVVTNSYFLPATDAVLRDGVFVSRQLQS
jgi:hypothetical protein